MAGIHTHPGGLPVYMDQILALKIIRTV